MSATLVSPLPRLRQYLWIGAICLALLYSMGSPHLAHAQVAAATNPDLLGGCGLDMILVLDESGSLDDDVATVRNSVAGLLEALADTSSRVAVVEFNETARTPLGAHYIDLTSDAVAPGGVFDVYLQNNYVPNGFTNWDAAFAKVAEINQSHAVAPLVIFFTDSEPTVYTNRFGSVVGGDINVTVGEAVESANVVKGQGSHIFVVGVGDILLESRLIAISGPDRYPDQQAAFGKADFTLTDLTQLGQALRQIAFSLCGPSVTITNYHNSSGGPQVAAGASFDGAVAINQSGEPAEHFVWTQPVSGAADQVGVRQSATTDGAGTAQWQWTPGTLQEPQPWPSQFTLSAAPQPGYLFASATCTRKTFNLAGGFSANSFALSTLPATFTVGPDDLITCDLYYDRLALTVQKSANPASVPEAGGDVTFSFQVTNNGTAATTLTSLTDSAFGNLHNQGSCVADGTVQLAVGATYQCSVVKRIAGNVGSPHTNTVTATLRAPNGATVSGTASTTVTFRDSTPTALLIHRAVPASQPEPGGLVTYTVQITNTNAGEPLRLAALNDSRFGDVAVSTGAVHATTCVVPRLLAPSGTLGSSYQCQFTATVVGEPGSYSDTLTAMTTDDDGNVASFTHTTSTAITNLPPAATLQVAVTPENRPEPGGTCVFTATVANLSAVEPLTLTLLNHALLDLAAPPGVTTTCALPQLLAPGASYRCTYRAAILQNSGTYTAAFGAAVADNEGSVLPLNRVIEIDLIDVPSALNVRMHAARTTLAEPGGTLPFTVTVENSSPVDTVTIQTLVDDRYGDLAHTCATALPVDLLPGAILRCTFQGAVSGPVGSIQSNAVLATGIDDDGKPISDGDEESIEITDVPSLLEVTQNAVPANLPEPGGVVTITTLIKNISLTDDVTIGKVETNEVDLVAVPALRAAGAALIDISTSCVPALPATLSPAEMQCRFTKTVIGPIRQRHTSNVIVSGMDDENLPLQQRSREAIDIIDVPSSIRVTESSEPVSVPEAGGLITFTVRVKNTSAVDRVTIETLTNSRFGDLTVDCPGLLPATLLPGDSISCVFSRFVSGDVDALLRQQTAATAIDDDDQAVADSTQSTIGVTDTPASLKLTQLAEPSGVTEPGAVVTFTVRIRNSSPVDDVTVHSVEESIVGDISARCLPALPVTLIPGAEVRCQYSDFVGGNAATASERTVTVAGIDDDGVAVQDFDLLTVDILDLLPQTALAATASPNQLLETGGQISMTVTLVNSGPEIASLTALSSTLAGDLNGRGDCVVPQLLAANGGTYQCTFTHVVDGVAGGTDDLPPNLVQALVVDDEGNVVTLLNEADLFLVAVEPRLDFSKVDGLLVDRFDNPADAGKVTPGDTLQYTITIRNSGNGAAQQVLLEDTPDPNSSLIVGSVTTSKGTILVGNSSGDTQVAVLIGELAIGEEATVIFNVLILEGTGTTLIRNQAFLSHGTFGDPGGSQGKARMIPAPPSRAIQPIR
ncbi:MAG: VWA domain-containing protein [Caldilineaceae bacterium]